VITYVKNKIKKLLYHVLQSSTEQDGVSISGFSRGLQNVQFEGKNKVPDRCNFSGVIKIGYATTLGYNNFLHGNITIGKYCQLGADVAMHSTNHPVNYLSTYINKNLFNGELSALKEVKNIEVGHDVWIGHNAIVVGEVRIGNGAIIASGAVVTRDVAPYSIVAGVPAKEIKKRFSEKIIQEIESLQWWDLAEEELEKIKPLFFKNLQEAKSIYDLHIL
jgi:acetyltransferase-like isoleucine patch superfamily enzyme